MQGIDIHFALKYIYDTESFQCRVSVNLFRVKKIPNSVAYVSLIVTRFSENK